MILLEVHLWVATLAIDLLQCVSCKKFHTYFDTHIHAHTKRNRKKGEKI
jgi:hypothetical protein